MNINEIIATEAFAFGNMPNISTTDYQKSYSELLAKSTKLADVRVNLELYLYSNRVYLLVKDKSIVLGNLNLSPIAIANVEYHHVDAIFVDPTYRKTSALYWLVYSVKEVLDKPVVADGAIFADGGALISAIQKHKSFNVWKLGKYSGTKTELDGPINNADYVYLFDSARIGFGKQIFVEGMPFTWFPLFDEIA